ncbi:hypothetical protein LZ30DRAFT_604748 [Colletotrichum cereale]|nr:hypothetical protein LZ30DRAFT_604748 [Colletotrichum cereale]
MLAVLFICCLVAAQANNDTASENSPFTKEMECYGLPYGTTGFVSHLLTYYTAITLAYNRTPLFPLKKLNDGPQNKYLAITKRILTTAASIASIVRCVDTWYVLITSISGCNAAVPPL